MPVKLKPVPLGTICEIVRAEPPELISVWESVLLLAEATFPKLRLVGFAASVAGVAPVPERERFRVELEASLTMARFPLTLPLDWGVKSTVKLVLWPAFSVSGKARLLMVNPLPLRLACVMVTEEVPELVSVSDSV